VDEEGLRGLTADNLADWHQVSVAALGFGSTRWPDAWLGDGLAPRMYFTGVTTRTLAHPHQARLADRLIEHFAGAINPIDVCDPFHQLDLSMGGFTRARLDRWMVRPAGGSPSPPPPGLTIEEVHDVDTLRVFEATSIAGFEVTTTLVPFSLHAPPLLDESRFRMWLGRVDRAPVSVAMAYIGDEVIGVYGVATIPEARRRGFGEALTWAATLGAPDRPAVLQPSRMGDSLYRRMGYEPFADFAVWTRTSVGSLSGGMMP
jgi:GNAT superfamily N-acetyltransferase